ncbi:MAG: GEVED domain-containing protein [Pseudomonadota bacterium]
MNGGPHAAAACLLIGMAAIAVAQTDNAPAPLQPPAPVPDPLPSPADDAREIPDYNDRPYRPKAWHDRHYLEWLGSNASEEAQPKEADDFDDGLWVLNPRIIAAGRTITLGVTVKTAWAVNPWRFQIPGKNTKLGVWIDWNHNKTFELNENVFTKVVAVPFVDGAKKFAHQFVTIPVKVPASYVQATGPDGAAAPPAMRVRLTLSAIGDPLLPGGRLEYGEVEDHDFAGNDLSYYRGETEPVRALASYSPAVQALSRDLLGSKLALVAYDVDGEIAYAKGVEALDLATLIAHFPR